MAPHCNSSSLNGTANPCRDEAVRTIGLPSMWRNIPATRSNTHQSAVGNHCERKKKKKEFGRRMEEPTLAGDSSCSNVVVTHCRDQNFIQFTAEQPYREQKMWPLFSPTRPSCLTAGGHMLVNGRALTAAVLRVKTDPSPDLGRVQMLLTFFE